MENCQPRFLLRHPLVIGLVDHYDYYDHNGHMKNEVSIAEAKARFSELVNRAAYGGERIVITKRGRPIAVLSPPVAGGLGAVKGWLDEKDPFFKDIEERERKRHQGLLRASRRR